MQGPVPPPPLLHWAPPFPWRTTAVFKTYLCDSSGFLTLDIYFKFILYKYVDVTYLQS